MFLGKGILKICLKISCFAALLKSHFGMVVLLQICCIFSEHLFLRTPLGDCFSLEPVVEEFHGDAQKYYMNFFGLLHENLLPQKLEGDITVTNI